MEFNSFPTYSELCELLENMVISHEALLRSETIGVSPGGREIRAIHVSNEEFPIEQKEIALIICGRHGDELGTRVLGPCLLEWLVSGACDTILKSQHIIVVPIANPDGCEKEVFGLPRDRLSGLEKKSILRLARKYLPDVVVDVHSVGKEKYGYNWGGLQAVVIDRNAKNGEDPFIFASAANEMIQHACTEGYPFLLHDVDFYRNLRARAKGVAQCGFNNYINRACYDAFHSLIFGVELNHFVQSPNDTAASGLAAIKPLLRMGNRTFPWEYFSGYPNRILSGDFLASIRAKGASAGLRRKSRQEIWKSLEGFVIPYNPYRRMLHGSSVEVLYKYHGGKRIKQGLTFCFQILKNHKVKKVLLNGQSTGFYAKRDRCCTYIFVDVDDLGKNREGEIVAEF